MAAEPYNEDSLVQRTTAEYLESDLGWKSVYAYNNEDFGPNSLLGRDSDREVVLKRTLREKLVEFNPGLPDTVYDDAVRQLTAVVASQSLVATNEEKYALIRNRVEVSYRNEEGERVRERLRVINYDDPLKNDFLCVRELWIRGDLYRRRADIVGFVNGLPLLFIECKNIHKNLKTAFEQNFSDYLDTIPHLFHHNAIVMFGNGDQGKIGSLTSRWEHFLEWKRLAEGEPGVVDMETLLKGICTKQNLIDYVENFIMFDTSAGRTIKIIARNHQFLGVNRAVQSVRDRKALDGKLGVFWHTQGSGKSYSMVFFTRKVHRKLGGNFTFVILTDRVDLDSQIYQTFAGCGVVDNDKDPCRSGSGPNLTQLLAQHKKYVFSLIQKFNQEIADGDAYTERDDLIVITDEAHRTQYGTLALNMRDALPNASYIGFTGTPLFASDEITKRVFGDYVSTYDFQQAVDDGATMPLFYDARGEKLGIDVGDLNDRVANVIDNLQDELADELEVQQKLERELKRDYHVITASRRLEQVARDLVQHYSTSWETGKAMLVCIDKVTCVRMHELITKYWDERIVELEQEERAATDEQEALYLQRQINWMRETRAAVVVSEEQGEVAKFRQWDIDITPHRRLVKEGIELPEAMRNKPEFRNLQRMDLEDAFKHPDHPFRIAIVCAMWLTGFDVPCLSTLYLDKPLKAHTLMQAIARANRVYEGKNNGLIVDYCGILRHLRKALATFAGHHEGEPPEEIDPAKPEEDLLAELAEAIALVRQFLDERSASLDEVKNATGFARNAAIRKCKEAANENDESRKRFEVLCRQAFQKFKACLTVDGVKAYRPDRDAINIVYKSLESDREQADISSIIQRLHEEVDEAIGTRPEASVESEPYDISRIDFDRLRQEFQRSNRQNSTVQDLRQAVENRLQKLLAANPLRTDFQQHYEQIVSEYNREKDRLTIERTFEALLRLTQELSEEEHRAMREGLDEESLAMFDLLKKDSLTPRDIKRIKEVAINLLATLKDEKLKVDQWRDKESTRDGVHKEIYDFLYSDSTGLPESYEPEEIETITEEVYRHVYRSYPYLPSPYYSPTSAA
ncbi:type I restriction endonuclease subunit R [Aeoliella sp. ICT_H6.2]|uniref:Type I restriction enzyme endonuclease subunit n=1 Tax=Aeoliella straminimaris TaxID=2954799 RepID=A0A9X2FBM7_9BACT|nr:type I restriction endonuclease subunit R [Aeoliella straminimaris]MCO6045920.1 type I restriction endonuclease subunit R [Aeoliella straminimaris]